MTGAASVLIFATKTRHTCEATEEMQFLFSPFLTIFSYLRLAPGPKHVQK